jgi:subtilisin family serine protease
VSRTRNANFVLPAFLLAVGLGGLALILIAVLPGSGNNPISLPTLKPRATSELPLDPKLASVLLQLEDIYQREGLEKARDFALRNRLMDEQNIIRLTLELDTDDPEVRDQITRKLDEWQVRIEALYPQALDIAFSLDQLAQAVAFPTPAPNVTVALPTINPGSLNLPPSLLRALADFEHIRRVHLPEGPSPEGLPAQRARGEEGVALTGASSWHEAGVTGKGVKVGILDPGGFLNYRDFLGTELPSTVQVRAFNRSDDIEGNSWDSDDDRVHGTACAEIVHDMAPDAELYLGAFDSFASQKEAIEWLENEGVRVISASFGSVTLPSDGKSVEGQLVDALRERGILWVNAAGNSAERHYMDTFNQDSSGYATFRNGKQVLEAQVRDTGPLDVVLRWDDWEERTIDYDLFLFDADGNEIARSNDVQGSRTHPPVETIKLNEVEAGTRLYLAISAGQDEKQARYHIFADGPVLIEDADPMESISSPADAEGALAVGAVDWRSDTEAPYSSEGPTEDGRAKPDMSAPAGVTSSSYGGQVFHGTSAAAPHVAGAAALVWSAGPSFSTDDVHAYLLQHALDLGEPGPDFEYGYGRLDLAQLPEIEPGLQIEATSTVAISTIQPTISPTRAISTPDTIAASTVTIVPGNTPEPPSDSVPGSPGWLATLGAGMVLGSLLTAMGIWVYKRSSTRSPAMPATTYSTMPSNPPAGASTGAPPVPHAGGLTHVQPAAPTARAPASTSMPAHKQIPPTLPQPPKMPAVPPKPAIMSKVFCPNCGRLLDAQTGDCRFCGWKGPRIVP